MLILILTGFILLRLLPNLIYQVPTGYDAGIYLYLFKIFPQIPQWQKLGFSPGLFYLSWPLVKLGISPESILVPMQILSGIFLFGCLYFVVKKLIDKKTALLAVFLLTISAVQFRAFWYFYVKNVFALGLMILSLYFLSQKKLIKCLSFVLLTAIFHLATFLMLVLTIIFSGFFTKNKGFYLKILVGGLLLGGLAYLTNWQLAIKPFLQPMLTMNKDNGGSFYSLGVSFLLTVLYLPLSIYGLSFVGKNKSNLKPFFTGTIVILAWVTLRLFFYNRFFITLDILLIFWAAIGLNKLMEKYKQYQDWWQFYLGILAVFIIGFVVKTGQPLITKQVLNEIKHLEVESNATILSTGKGDAAWLMGYTNRPVIAWKYGGEDQYWTHEQWQLALSQTEIDEKSKLFKLLPQPMYLFINDINLTRWPELQQPPCFELKSLHFYKFVCID